MMNFLKHHWSKRDKFLARWSLLHVIVAVVIGSFLAVGLVFWQLQKDATRTLDLRQMAQQVQDVSTAPPGTKNIGGPFQLVNQDGKAVSDADYAGKYKLIYFGYTYCPDMCPTGLQSMGRALHDLGADADKVAALFITIDPARDTSEKMKAYVQSFDQRIQGLTGSDEQTAAVTAAYQVYYAKGEQVDEHDYVMDHSSMIYLMTPEGSFVTTFPEDADPTVIVKAIRQQIDSKP